MEEELSERKSIESKTTITKVRIFTDLPKKYVLVGRNKITNNIKIYKSPMAFMHMPWLETLYIATKDNVQECKEQTYQLGVDGLEAKTRFSIWWRIRKDRTADDLTFTSRWISFFRDFGSSKSKYYKRDITNMENAIKQETKNLRIGIEKLNKDIAAGNFTTEEANRLRKEKRRLMELRDVIIPEMKNELRERKERYKTNKRKTRTSRWLAASLIAALTGISGICLSPIVALIPLLITFGYVSFFHQDQEWVEKQGEYKYFMQDDVKIEQFEEPVTAAIGKYFAHLSPDDIKNIKINLNAPEFSELKRELALLSKDYGIDVFKITVSPANLTEESDSLLKRKKQADADLYEAQKREEAKKLSQKRYLELMKEAINEYKLEKKEAIEYVKTQMAMEANGTRFFNYGGNANPIFGMNCSQEEPKQKTK